MFLNISKPNKEIPYLLIPYMVPCAFQSSKYLVEFFQQPSEICTNLPPHRADEKNKVWLDKSYAASYVMELASNPRLLTQVVSVHLT